jgi:transcriptional regulator with XRE-family HTH domain
VAHSLPDQRRRELEALAASRRAGGEPPARTAAELAARGGISRLWAWRLATGWRRSELLARLRQLGDLSVDESMLWRWELGERDPSSYHLDYLCRVYQTRPDLLGYGHDYSQPTARRDGATTNGQPASAGTLAAAVVTGALACEPLAMLRALTTSSVSSQTLEMLERTASRPQQACQTQAAPLVALALELTRQYGAVRDLLEGHQRVQERRRLAAVAARLGSQLGLLLWKVDEPVALAYFDASVVAAEEAGDPALGAWVAERRAGRTTRELARDPHPVMPSSDSRMAGERRRSGHQGAVTP